MYGLSGSLNELRAIDARQTIAEKLEAEKLRLQNRLTARAMEGAQSKRHIQRPPSVPNPFPNPDQKGIDSFWDNARRLGRIQGRGDTGTGDLPGGDRILGHVGPAIGGLGDAERANAARQAEALRKEAAKTAMAGLKGARR
jgi:hypothetical protein